MRFKDKVVLITGASKGIGRATAFLFAKEGAKIIVNYFSSETEAKKAVHEIKALGSDAIAVKCDVSQEDEVISMIKQSVDTFGRIDILVNNAGIVSEASIFEKALSEWNKTIGVNLRGNYLCTKYVAKAMLKNKSGKIINISSTSAIHTFSPDIIDYDVSKAGIIALTKDFAKAFAPYVQVNAIAPGWVDTDINKTLGSKVKKEELNKIYLKRFAQPNEIAEIILFLASPAANYINGTVLVADGGHD